MEDKSVEKFKTMLSSMEKEYECLSHYQRAKVAIEQISMWQHKFNEAKVKIQRENIIDATSTNSILSQYPEIEA